MWIYVVLCGLLGNAKLKKQGESPTSGVVWLVVAAASDVQVYTM